MNLIYAHATQVVVWLGEADYNSRFVFSCQRILDHVLDSFEPTIPLVRRRRTKIWGYWRHESWKCIAKAFYDAMLRDEELTEVLEEQRGPGKAVKTAPNMPLLFLQSLGQFVMRPCFRRVWILQEAFLAKRDEHDEVLVTVIAGSSTMDWLHLMGMCYFIDELLPKELRDNIIRGGNLISSEEGLTRPLVEFKRSWSSPSQSFMNSWILSTAHFEASDPRDKLFALLHLARDTREIVQTEPLLFPNYEKSISYLRS